MTDQTENEAGIESILTAVASGELSVSEAVEQLQGVRRVDEFARVDTRQGERTGIPEIVEAEKKRDEELIEIGQELLDGTGRAILTGISADVRDALTEAAATADYYDASRTLVVHSEDFQPPTVTGQVGVVSAGTSDIPIAQQAVVLATEMGCQVETVYDVGVSGIHRLLAERDRLADCDVVIVAAGREGALATVVAGLLDVPIIGLPVSTGTGAGGEGEAALLGMLQSCTYLTVVNIDAGFVAGGQAALIAR